MRIVKIIMLLLIISILFTGCTKNELTAVSVVHMPDVEQGENKKGFTCTGLVYDKNEGVFYSGNIGKALPTTEGFKSTIVKLSNDLEQNLGELKLYEIYPDMADIQGVTIDHSNDTFWFCSFAENMVRNVSKSGVDMGVIDFDRPIGIAYDNRDDSLWVLSNEFLCNIKKNGEVVRKIDVKIEGQDQLYLDVQNNTMYFTAGVNYKGKNYVYSIDLNTEEICLKYILKDSHAVEGIHIDNNKMYVLNDGYYHEGKEPVNQANIYDLYEEK